MKVQLPVEIYKGILKLLKDSFVMSKIEDAVNSIEASAEFIGERTELTEGKADEDEK